MASGGTDGGAMIPRPRLHHRVHDEWHPVLRTALSDVVRNGGWGWAGPGCDLTRQHRVGFCVNQRFASSQVGIILIPFVSAIDNGLFFSQPQLRVPKLVNDGAGAIVDASLEELLA